MVELVKELLRLFGAPAAGARHRIAESVLRLAEVGDQQVRLADGAIVGRCAAGDGPSHLAAHPDGTRIYSANSWDGTLSCLSADGVRLAQSFSGGWAHAIDISPDGLWIYVANFLDDTLAVFDAESLQRLRVLSTDPYPHGLDVAADGAVDVVRRRCESPANPLAL